MRYILASHQFKPLPQFELRHTTMWSTLVVCFIIITFIFCSTPAGDVYGQEANNPHELDRDEDTQSVILEVQGDPNEHLETLNARHPLVEIVKTFDVLFNGIAIKGSPDKIERVGKRDFVNVIHPVATYSVPQLPEASEALHIDFKAMQQYKQLSTDRVDRDAPAAADASTTPNVAPDVIPGDLNTTRYTGRGVDVGVIDTGIDMAHPDLKENYEGGYDLVDLDDQPMETQESEGNPTRHGTHVAGIIAADGHIKGVAPDADLYAYRALGPGGRGTSVQVIAALEQAVEDGMDIINLSLGNTVNGPDFPTSQAVNKASEAGTLVVTANGNDGPKDWTVGSPATATGALSVGATSPAAEEPYLYHAATDEQIELMPMIGARPWTLQTDYPITFFNDENADMTGQIVLAKRGETSFHEVAKQAENNGAKAVLIMNNEAGLFAGSVADEDPISIPVAAITQEAGQHLKQLNEEREHLFVDTKYKHVDKAIAPFSSRGPVTVNWAIKPQIAAPGVNVLSTVPQGYEELQGTSMAAPHVAGALAVLKEARPDWSNTQLKNALTTTADSISDSNNEQLSPTVQGLGAINIGAALKSTTLIDNAFLTYGRIDDDRKEETLELKIENTSEELQTFDFSIPKKTSGFTWQLPKTFTVEPGQTKDVPIKLDVSAMLLKKGVHQDWLHLNRSDGKSFQIPYLFVNQTADYPRAMGVAIEPKPYSKAKYTYQFYLPDDVDKVTIDLYGAHSLIHEMTLLETKNVQKGLNEGTLKKEKVGKPGTYRGVMSLTHSDGTIETAEFSVTIPPL